MKLFICKAALNGIRKAENSNTESLFYIILSLVTSWPIGYACSHAAYWRGCKGLHTSNIDPLVIIFFS